jgi:hypothetical protein
MNRRFWIFSSVLVLAATATCAGGVETESEPDTTKGPGPTTSGGGSGGSGGTVSTGGSTTTTTSTAGGGGAGGSGGAAPVCGDGMMDQGEGCDDGNQNNNDSCPDGVNGSCQPAECGDGFLWDSDGGSESCDDGNQANDDNCPDGAMGTCEPASCSDGFQHSMGTGTEQGVDCGGSCPGGCPGELLLSEIVVTTTAAEMIEIHNPSARPIALDDVYLADYPMYYEITQVTSAPISSDFRVQFPPGTTIAAGEHITISAQSATEFNTTYGSMPDFDLDSGDTNAPVMLGEIGGSAGLSNSDEMLVMFYWNGTSDLVMDIDYLVWGNNSDAMDKSNVTVGLSTYNTETATSSQSIGSAPGSGQSLGHCQLTEAAETTVGGNGPGGADETSENMAATWELLSPTPGTFNNCNVVVSVDSQANTMYLLKRSDFSTLGQRAITMTGQTVDGANAIARHPTTGVTYAIIKLTSTRPLAMLNTATGVATLVGTPADFISSMAFLPNGTLYGVVGNGGTNPEQMNTINLTTGALTSITTFNDAGDGEALAYSPQTSLLYRMSGLSSPLLQSVNPVGPVVTPITYIGSPPSEAMGTYWDPDASNLVVFDGGFDVLTVALDGTVTATNFTVPSAMRGGVIQ